MAKHEMYSAIRIGSFKISLMYPLAASKLPEDLYVKVFTLYEMLRVADIIEDCKKSNNDNNTSELLNLHSESLYKERFSEEVNDFVINNASTKKEKSAADYYDLFFRTFTRLPDTTKEIIASTNNAMIPGMINEDYKDIKTWKQQYEYAGYVAGEVGKGLTRLFAEYLDIEDLESMMEKGYLQGVALQKINILRDLKEDISNEKNYVPEELLKLNKLNRKSFLKKHITNSYGKELFFDKDEENHNNQQKVIKAMSLNAQHFLETGLEYVSNMPLYNKDSEKYAYSNGIRIFTSALLLVGQEMAHNIYTNPCLVENKYSPKSLLIKYGLFTSRIWNNNNKISEKFYEKKIAQESNSDIILKCSNDRKTLLENEHFKIKK
jgi:phytoene/squalene synthetase